jgi:biopolymer transport protein ExbD
MFDKAFNQNNQVIVQAELSTTPLIDMVFLLLIFFAVTTNFTKETGIQVDKANATTARIISRDLIMISIDKEGNYWYDGKIQELNLIASQVYEESRKKKEMNVVLIPDKGGKVDPLIQLMDVLRARGITKFSLGTRMNKGG